MNTPVNSRKIPSSSGYPLISKERTQKLDLLNHLIANLSHTVVVSGPEGIGKSKLLKTFHQDAAQSCMVCWLQGDSKLKLEKIQDSLVKTIAENLPDLKSQPLAVALDRIHSRGAKVVLIIDDAGGLVPGLIEKIIIYANANPAVRVVLALTHSELYLKTGTDPAIEEGYLIEIPPLTAQQCEDFLEYLSTLPQPRIEFNNINEDKIAEIFRETHGVPGRILTFLPKPIVKKTVDHSKPILFSSVAGLIILALGIQWWSNNHHVEEDASVKKPEPSSSNSALPSKVATEKAHNIQPNSLDPLPVDKISAEKPAQTPAQNTPTLAVSQKGAENSQAINNVEQKSQPVPAGSSAAKTGISQNVVPQNQEVIQGDSESGGNVSEGGHWLMAQPSENYTLQLMALSDEKIILEVLQRYPELGDDLRYLKTKTRRGKDRFVLFYGSFSDPEQIKAQKEKLPKELQKIWIRKIADFQKEINKANESHAQTQGE